MLKIKMHTASDYATLPDIDSGESFTLSHKEENCLDQVGNLLVENGYNNKFGLSLLHNHFPVKDEEVMIEELIDTKLLLSPKSKSSVKRNFLQPINLAFSSSSQNEMIGLEYLLSDKEEVNIFTSEEENILKEVRTLLDQSECLNTFGVWVVRNSFQSHDDKIMMESCDQENRVLSCELVDKSIANNINSTQTFWLWDSETPENKKVVRGCVRVCTKYSDGTHSWGIHNNSY